MQNLDREVAMAVAKATIRPNWMLTIRSCYVQEHGPRIVAQQCAKYGVSRHAVSAWKDAVLTHFGHTGVLRDRDDSRNQDCVRRAASSLCDAIFSGSPERLAEAEAEAEAKAALAEAGSEMRSIMRD